MTQNYRFFIGQWRECLSDYEHIFSSINAYSIIKFLKEYWNSREVYLKVTIRQIENIIIEKLHTIVTM